MEEENPDDSEVLDAMDPDSEDESLGMWYVNLRVIYSIFILRSS